jgi:hypothetical protein
MKSDAYKRPDLKKKTQKIIKEKLKQTIKLFLFVIVL